VEGGMARRAVQKDTDLLLSLLPRILVAAQPKIEDSQGEFFPVAVRRPPLLIQAQLLDPAPGCPPPQPQTPHRLAFLAGQQQPKGEAVTVLRQPREQRIALVR